MRPYNKRKSIVETDIEANSLDTRYSLPVSTFHPFQTTLSIRSVDTGFFDELDKSFEENGHSIEIADFISTEVARKGATKNNNTDEIPNTKKKKKLKYNILLLVLILLILVSIYKVYYSIEEEDIKNITQDETNRTTNPTPTPTILELSEICATAPNENRGSICLNTTTYVKCEQGELLLTNINTTQFFSCPELSLQDSSIGNCTCPIGVVLTDSTPCKGDNSNDINECRLVSEITSF
eukprot:snap_masked-scaffold_17-processed-gene-2.26-mRNA-1 protein AED:1.00 eAED:1.00 QI:0/0/0/0/1/1/3/0/237